jgi:hypothetical protein
MNEFERLSPEFDENNLIDAVYNPNVHLDESMILQYVDDFMSGGLNSERVAWHFDQCGLCKNKALQYFNYYGFNELVIK